MARRALAAPGRDASRRPAIPVVLPWGSDDERARSERYAAGVANAHVPPPPRHIAAGARGPSRARRARRRRRHRARASRRRARHADRVALRRDGSRCAAASVSPVRRRATSVASAPCPTPEAVERAAGGIDATRAALLMDSDARPLFAAVERRAAARAAAPRVARPPRARLSRARRRALRPISRTSRRRESSGCTPCRSAKPAPPRRSSSVCAARTPTRRCC